MLKMKEPKLFGTWHMVYHVKTVAGLTEDQASCVLFGNWKRNPYETWCGFEAKPLKVTIDYPVRKPIVFTLKPKTEVFCGQKQTYWSLGIFLWQVAQKYVEIYKDPIKNQIWGHDISDLEFECVTVKKNGTVELGIGS